MQLELKQSNASLPPPRSINIRIGIHVGDIIHRKNDVYGDAVSIASRIEALSPPGGICVTEQVQDQTRNKFEFPFIALGRHESKNVQVLMKIYKIGLPWEKGEVAGSGLDKHRIAIMPLVNMTGDSKDEYFIDGMNGGANRSNIEHKRAQCNLSNIGYEILSFFGATSTKDQD